MLFLKDRRGCSCHFCFFLRAIIVCLQLVAFVFSPLRCTVNASRLSHHRVSVRNKAQIWNLLAQYQESQEVLSTIRLGSTFPSLALHPRAKLAAFAVIASEIIRKASTTPVRRAVYFWKEAAPIVVHYKFTQWWLSEVKHSDRNTRDLVYGRLHRKYCIPSYHLVLHLKGLYVKIGQVLSSRPDFVPFEYVRLFATLQDSIPQWSIEHVKNIVNESLMSEHGLTFEHIFQSIDPIALGSASIGQVHRAVLTGTLTQSGRGKSSRKRKEVAVKVMHPDSQERFRNDFQVFRWLCRLALPDWAGLLNELERRIMTEFDYRNEASSLALVRENLESSPYRRRVYIPRPHEHLCCKHVLVMELLHGQKLVDHVKQKLDAACGIEGTASKLIEQRQTQVLQGGGRDISSGIDGRVDDLQLHLFRCTDLRTKFKLLAVHKQCQKYVDILINVHGYQIFIDGTFNGDPHPGNVLVLTDGRLGLIDYGQTRKLNNEERLGFAHVVQALCDGSNDTVVADMLCHAGFASKDDLDTATLAKYAKLFFDSDLESQKLGFATPQLYYASLMKTNPLIVIPDAAVFIARTSFLFRGMGTVIGSKAIQTAHYWSKHAKKALKDAGVSIYI